MNEQVTYRVRFRFKLQKKLHLNEKVQRFEVAGHEIALSSQFPEKNIADDDWLVMNARGFESEQAAAAFGHKLRAAVEFSSIAARLGVNAGVDRPTSGFGRIVKDAVHARDGTVLRDNVHGVDVFADDPNVRIGCFSAVGTVRASPDPFLSDLNSLFDIVETASSRANDIVLLLNYALMRTDPVAQIVFSISAVEMLGQNENWTPTQRQLLEALASDAEKAGTGTEEECQEVAAAIRRGVQRLSLRQGVLRLLASLGLIHLKAKWEELYTARSELVHGLAPMPGVDYSELAHRSVSLCGHILLTAVASEIAGADKHLEKFYPTS